MLALMEGVVVIYSYEALSLVFVVRESQRAESVLRGEGCNSVALPERLSSGVRKCDLCTSTLGHTRRQVSVRFLDDTRYTSLHCHLKVVAYFLQTQKY